MGLQRVGHRLVTKQEQQQLYQLWVAAPLPKVTNRVRIPFTSETVLDRWQRHSLLRVVCVNLNGDDCVGSAVLHKTSGPEQGVVQRFGGARTFPEISISQQNAWH